MFILKKAEEISQQAISANRMNPIQVDTQRVEQAGTNYLVRVAKSQGAKPAASNSPKRGNPFLPYEEELFISLLGPDHVCLLNKYPVIANHLLVITRQFQPQESLLTLNDFTAMTALLQEADGLMFYNSGVNAGASQAHKHMQWVPRQLDEPHDQLPLEPGEIPLPFHHCWFALNQLDASAIYALYQQGLAELQWREGRAYNLLLTRQWLMLVPRSQAAWQQISLNSLAFVGSFFVKDELQANQLRYGGFAQALAAVSGWPATNPQGDIATPCPLNFS